MLAQYLTLTQQLLQNPQAPVTLYSLPSLTSYINIARGQIAGEGECVRSIGTLTATIGQRSYNFSSINFGTVATTGIQGAINVRRIQYVVASGQKWVKAKSWEWFDLYRFNTPVPLSGAPTEWAQYGQGSAGQNIAAGASNGNVNSGSFYLDPLPDIAYTLNCDCVCYPQPLALDTDVEALPYLWTDAVPYFAAYQALMGAQTSVRLEQAQRLFGLYEQFMSRARNAANPSQNNGAYEQAADPFKGNRLGIAAQRGAA